MITVTTAYVTRDGNMHRRHADAVMAEERLDAIDAANKILDEGGNLHAAIKAWGYQINPAQVFKLMTKDTKLAIPHWQCRDEPGYVVMRFDKNGIRVGGDAGSWSGFYADYVSVTDLERYARNTFRNAY